MSVIIRTAEKKDVAHIVKLTRELAEYENMSQFCTITEEMFSKLLFEEHSLNALVAEKDGIVIGIASYYFYKISTFSGKKVLYLEDLYIIPEARGMGTGRKFFDQLKKIAKNSGCGKIQWKCLKWNEPSLAFYDKIGGIRDDEWITYDIPNNDF